MAIKCSSGSTPKQQTTGQAEIFLSVQSAVLYYASGEKFEPLIKVQRLYHRNQRPFEWRDKFTPPAEINPERQRAVMKKWKEELFSRCKLMAFVCQFC